MYVVTAQQMKQVEEISLSYDLSYARLMENAGSASAAFIRATLSPENRNCVIFCGKGNNGGDGFVVARKLFEIGVHVVVVLVEGTPGSKEAQTMLSMLDVLDIPVITATDKAKMKALIDHADIIVDAIYGTGFHKSLSPEILEICRLIADSIAGIVSLDVPSGVECDTGYVATGAIKADFTVAFDALKPPHIFTHTLQYCGRVECVPIGIPLEAYDGIPSLFSKVQGNEVWSLLPARKPDSHKGTYGTLLALTGSLAYRGAAVLSTLGALRTGVGLCTLAAVESVCNAVITHSAETTLLPLPERDGGIDLSSARTLLAAPLSKAQSILFGCGSGDTPTTQAVLDYLLGVATSPIVLDADALNALSSRLDLLGSTNASIILTPHPGEMARLAHISLPEVQQNRTYVAWQFAKKHRVHVVLKGHETVIATPEGRIYQNTTGGPGLARAGSGDILAGMIAALLAQGLGPTPAAIAGVWLHGAAGDRCASRKSQYSMLPSDILDDLGTLFLEQGR